MQKSTRSYIAFFVLGLGTMIAPLDTAVNVAFPRITRDFDVPLSDIRWVIICYVLTHTTLMLIFGKLGDIYGHKRIFSAGLALSIITFILCAVAWRFEYLLIFRVTQGVSAALVMSCGPAIATSLFSEKYRAKVLGLYLTMFGLGSVLGPSLGGLLVSEWDWPAVFWFRAPIALTALLLVFLIPGTPPAHSREKFDPLGALLIAITMSAFLITITQLQQANEHPIVFISCIFASIFSLLAYVRRASNQQSPVIRLNVFLNVEFTMLNLGNIVINFTGFSVLLLVPYYLARESEFSIGYAGLVLAMAPLGVVLGSPSGGWAISRFPANRFALLGILLVGLSILMIARWERQPGLIEMIAPLLVSGVGLGLFQVAYMNIVTGTLPIGDRGVAGSLAMLTRTIGVVSAAAILTWLFDIFKNKANAFDVATSDAFISAFGETFDIAGSVLLVFLLLSLLRPATWLGTPKGVDSL